MKGLHTFPYGIIPKMKVIAKLVFELAYYDVIVQWFNHYPAGTSLCIQKATHQAYETIPTGKIYKPSTNLTNLTIEFSMSE